MPIVANVANGNAGRSRTAPKTAAKPAAAKPKDTNTAAKATLRPAVAKPPSAPAPATRERRLPEVDADQRLHYVEVAAYYIAERRSFLGGCEAADWAEAEREIDRLLKEGKLSV